MQREMRGYVQHQSKPKKVKPWIPLFTLINELKCHIQVTNLLKFLDTRSLTTELKYTRTERVKELLTMLYSFSKLKCIY